MATLLFNVDKTLLHSHSLFYPLASFHPAEALLLSPAYPLIAPTHPEWHDYLASLRRPYHHFTFQIVSEELSDTPLGILRPGIFHVMERIQRLYVQGRIRQVAFYSSNPFTPLLSFVAHVVRSILVFYDTPFPIQCIVGPPPLSYDSPTTYVIDDHYPSTWPTPNERHLRIPPYTFQASAERVLHLYMDALEKASVPWERVKEANTFLFQRASSFAPRLTVPPKEAVRSLLLHRIGATVCPSVSPPKNNGMKALHALLDTWEQDNLNEKHIRPSE